MLGEAFQRQSAAERAWGKALELLEPIFSRFSEGFKTLDLVAADNLLQQLRSRNGATKKGGAARPVP